jgi:hypothetical protein
MMIGMKSALALTGGGTLALLGLFGLAVSLAAARRPGRERGGAWHVVPVVAPVLLLAVGVSVLLGVGVISPLRLLKQEVFALGRTLERIEKADARVEAALEVANRSRCAEDRRAILGQPKYQDPKRLNRHEYRVFSQNGEDGIIAEVFRRIGTTNRYFVEFGAADGFENNTVLLLRQGWKGLWIDGDPAAVDRARAHFRPEVEGKQLTIFRDFITAENIEALFHRAEVPYEPDLLSIDIDRNDYYVWEKIGRYRPRVAIVEYNALYPPTMSWVIPYDPKGWWDGTSHYGASLKALEELGARKGYSLVGCNISGVNAFFVRDDLLGDHFAAPYTAENHYEPSRYDLYWHDSNHRRVP